MFILLLLQSDCFPFELFKIFIFYKECVQEELINVYEYLQGGYIR